VLLRKYTFKEDKMLKLMGKYIKFNLAAAMEYRVSFIVQVLGMALNNSAFIFFWLILFERVGDINGYGFREVMLLWSLAAAGFGVNEVFLGNGRSLSRIIYQGELDVYLLQPVPLLPNILSSRMSVSGWGDIVYGVILFFFTQELSFLSITLFSFSSILAALLFSSVNVLYHSLTFYLGNGESLAMSAYNMVLTFATYPGSIFKGASTWIMHTILPAGLIIWIPMELILDFTWGKFLLLIGADCVLILSALIIFRTGIKRYASGNRMGTRI
jgi:ABC-2 type transport system permease protein